MKRMNKVKIRENPRILTLSALKPLLLFKTSC